MALADRAARCGSRRRGWSRSPSARSPRSLRGRAASTARRASSSSRSWSPTSRSRAEQRRPARRRGARRRRSLARTRRPQDLRAVLVHRTKASGCAWPPAMDHVIDGARRTPQPDSRVRGRPRAHDGHRRARPRRAAAPDQVRRLRLVEPGARCRRCATRSRRRWPRPGTPAGTSCVRRQREYLDEFWERADVEIDGEPRLQQAVRFGMFHVLQAGARGRGPGDPGQGPDRPRLRRPRLLGHRDLRAADAHLLDARTRPRDALRWRHSTLEQAPASAPSSSASRAPRFPWRTIRGRGVLGLLAGGHRRLPRQRRHRRRGRRATEHATGDEDFERDVRPASCWSRRRGCGARSATTTRTAASASTASPGPTSTAPLADNNVYTNLMAPAEPARRGRRDAERWPERAARARRRRRRRRPRWRDAADGDDDPLRRGARRPPAVGGLHRPRALGLRGDPGRRTTRCFLHFPYFDLYRKQVVKQADLVLALHCRGDAFTRRAEGAQLRLLRAADRPRLVALGLHPGGCRGRGRPPRPRLRLLRPRRR